MRHVRIYRTDFSDSKDSDGRSHFDYILEQLGVAEEYQADAKCVILEVTSYEVFDSEGKTYF